MCQREGEVEAGIYLLRCMIRVLGSVFTDRTLEAGWKSLQDGQNQRLSATSSSLSRGQR